MELLTARFSHTRFIFLNLSSFSSNWRQKTLWWNWLVVSAWSNSCAHFALEIHISTRVRWKSDAAMRANTEINELLPLLEWMHGGCYIDSLTRDSAQRPHNELGVIYTPPLQFRTVALQICSTVQVPVVVLFLKSKKEKLGDQLSRHLTHTNTQTHTLIVLSNTNTHFNLDLNKGLMQIKEALTSLQATVRDETSECEVWEADNRPSCGWWSNTAAGILQDYIFLKNTG